MPNGSSRIGPLVVPAMSVRGGGGGPGGGVPVGMANPSGDIPVGSDDPGGGGMSAIARDDSGRVAPLSNTCAAIQAGSGSCPGDRVTQVVYDTQLQMRKTMTTANSIQIAFVTRPLLNHVAGAASGGPSGDLRGGQLMWAS
jgi:hypothetical protein